MTEYSYPWDGLITGDATLAPYSDDEWSDIWKNLFQGDLTEQGVICGYLNELACVGSCNTIIRRQRRGVGILLNRLGYLIATFLLMVLMFGVMRKTKWSIRVAAAAVTVLATYILFYVWLEVSSRKECLVISNLKFLHPEEE